jgi:hypothetical protein
LLSSERGYLVRTAVDRAITVTSVVFGLFSGYHRGPRL